MKKMLVMLLIAALALTGAALAEAAAVDKAVVDRFTDTWVADGFTAEIWYEEAEGGFCCDMVIGDTFCDYRDCHYDAAADTLVCENGVRYHATYDETAVDYKKDIVSEGLTAVFAIKDDRLTCEDSEGLVKDVVFLRLDEAEEIDGQALYEGSAIYTHRDMESAFIMVENKFDTWEGCEMHNIRYAGDACVTEDNLKWMNELGGKTYRNCIEILTDFHSPVEGGGAWEADTDYKDFQWWLARTDGGEWELLTWGY